MSTLSLDPAATKVFLSKGLADPKLKKAAVRLADRAGSLFLTYIGIAYFQLMTNVLVQAKLQRRRRVWIQTTLSRL